MSFTSKSLILFLSITVTCPADKDKERFDPGPANAYPARQTVQDLTIAVKAYGTEELAREAFGKLNPNKHGILPVLVVTQNDGREALNLDAMRVEYIAPTGENIEATPAEDVRYARGPSKPNVAPAPVPRVPGVGGRKKNPLDAWEIEGRAFAAKMLPPGESAHGFVYFQTPHRKGAKIYITGIREAPTGKELFFFEIPLEK